jgi:hypothetical protein
MIGRNPNLDFVHLVLKHKGQYITTDMIENSDIFCYSATLKNKRIVPKGVYGLFFNPWIKNRD